MHRILLLLLILFCSTHLHAQEEFSPGTMLLTSGDTIRGFIKNVTGRISPRIVEFRQTATGEAKVFTPRDVKWFRFKIGGWFFSYAGALESSSLNNNNLTYDSSLHSVTDTFFITAVLISRASLFYARDKNDRVHLFMSKKNSDITELLYKKYYVDEVVLANYQNKITKRAIMANEIYKAQLITAFGDCPYVATGILSRLLPYAKSDMLKIFDEYNRCKGAKIIYKEKQDNGKFIVSVQAGINFTGVKLKSEFDTVWNQIEFNRSLGFQFGMGFNWLLPELEGKWSAYNELLVKTHFLDGADVTVDPPTSYTLDAIYLKVISMGQYRVITGSVKPFFGLGITNSFSLGHKTTGEPPKGLSIFGVYRNYEQGLICNFGLRWKDFDTELRFEMSNGWSGYSDLHTGFTTWYLQFGYAF